MNIFASERINSTNIKFPKGMDKLEWREIKSNAGFEQAFRQNKKPGTVVIDAFAGEHINGLRTIKAIIEISIEKHEPLPTLLVVGPDLIMKEAIQYTIAKNKRWLDIASGKK